MLFEELHEADILWPDTATPDRITFCSHRDNMFNSSDHNHKLKRNSTPIAIPKTVMFGVGDWWENEDCKVLEEQMVPPHILVSQRVSREMAFSICGGMRWRELSFLRDAILRMTGFLES